MKKIVSVIALLLLMMVSCHRHPESIVKEINTVATDSIETTDHINWDDSFTVVYRQPVNGYQVKVIVKPEESDVLIMKANISFEKSGKAFTLHTSCFGDTLFCKGRFDYDF